MLAPLHDADLTDLRDPAWLAGAIAQLGLEHPTRTPEAFPRTFGGLRIWQTPIQFAPYLIALSELGINSYAELGVHAGGSFMVTLEYLARFGPVEPVLAVDAHIQPTVAEYVRSRERATVIEAHTNAPAVEEWLAAHRPDLVFIDADHSARGCGADYDLASRYARYVALHDIVEWSCQGVHAVWGRIDAPKQAWTDQYDSGPALHGIGLVGPLR